MRQHVLVSGLWGGDEPGRLSAVDSCLVDDDLLSWCLAEVNSGQTLKAAVTPTATDRVQYTECSTRTDPRPISPGPRMPWP
jgi:hypothetical protein